MGLPLESEELRKRINDPLALLLKERDPASRYAILHIGNALDDKLNPIIL